MWNALGTRISLSKAPNSFFPEPEPMAAQPASAAHAMGHHCDLAFGTTLLLPPTLSLMLPLILV